MRRLWHKWATKLEYWRQDRACAKHGHNDYPCWAETANGVKCGRCGRILWTWWLGYRDGQPPQYQKPSRQVYWR
jgi:hypothetical protein